MVNSPANAPLEEVLNLIPQEFQSPEVRQRLINFARELDQLLAIDDKGELTVDRDVAMRIVQNKDFIPSNLQDQIRRELEAHLGGKIKSAGKNRHITWRELVDQDTPIKPIDVGELRAKGMGAACSAQKARQILDEHYPGFPKFWLDADADKIREAALQGFKHNRTVWDCCVAHLGFWAALAVFAAAGAFLIVGTATGPWGIPLAIFLIATLGLGSGTIVANCVLNPNS
jgi:hypothetical protein